MQSIEPNDIERLLSGDASDIESVRVAPHDVVLSAWQRSKKPVLSGAAVRRVIDDLAARSVEPVSVQLWASFMMRGYLQSVGPAVMPIDIEYESRHEASIADAIAVLEQIGDSIDGAPDESILRRLIEDLSDR